MTINLQKPDITELKPRITVFGVGGGGGNAVNNMINAGLEGVDFVVANTDAQALSMTKASRVIQMGVAVTEGLGAGSRPEVGRAAAEECIDEIIDHLSGTHMCFVTAGMGGGTGTGAAPVVAQAAREKGILTVGVVTKPFHFEGQRRMRLADSGIEELQACVDTLIVIPNQNLFRIANEKTTFADAFGMADQVLYSGVACITDLMVKEGLINLDFADVRSVMREMGKAMMGTGEASGEGRAMAAAEAAIANPLLDETSMKGAQGLLISITGGRDLTLFEVDEAATRIREEVDPDANIILGATFDEELEGLIRVSVVATGIDKPAAEIGSDAQSPARTHAEPIRQAAPVRPAQPQREAVAARPVTAAQPKQQPSVETVAISEADIEAELRLDAEETKKPSASEDFAPQSRLFTPQQPVDSEQKRPMAGYNVPPSKPAPAPKAEPAAAPVAANTQDQDARATVEAVRMPRVEDFPPVVQAEIEHRQQGVRQPQPADERGPMGLLKRISSSLGRRDEEDAPRVQASEPAPRSTERRQPEDDASLYAPRRGQLDDQGRVVKARRPQADEDQLEIPAFLRRQAN